MLLVAKDRLSGSRQCTRPTGPPGKVCKASGTAGESGPGRSHTASHIHRRGPNRAAASGAARAVLVRGGRARAGRPANVEVLPVGSEREPRVTLLGRHVSPRVSSAGSSLHLKRDAPRPERRLAKLRPVRRRQAVSGPRLLNDLFSEATQERSPGSGSSAVHSPTLQAARAPFPSGTVNIAPAQDANGGRRPSAVTDVL